MNNTQHNYCVYMHVSRLCDKVYIGITNNTKARWARKAESYRRCPYIYNAFRKYGWDNFSHVVLNKGLTKEEACEEEKEWIAFFKLGKMSYNIADGGEGTPGVKHSDKRRRQISMQLMGRPCSAETRKKISKAIKGKKTKRIYAFNPDTKTLVAEYPSIREVEKVLGIKHTNISRAAKGLVATAGGYIWSYHPYIEISQEIINRKKDNRVYCYDLDGNYIKVYKSAIEAAKAINGGSCMIGQCCSKNRLQYKGFIWRRHIEEIEPDIIQKIKNRRHATNKD